VQAKPLRRKGNSLTRASNVTLIHNSADLSLVAVPTEPIINIILIWFDHYSWVPQMYEY
jgi:hypothetical protein